MPGGQEELSVVLFDLVMASCKKEGTNSEGNNGRDGQSIGNKNEGHLCRREREGRVGSPP